MRNREMIGLSLALALVGCASEQNNSTTTAGDTSGTDAPTSETGETSQPPETPTDSSEPASSTPGPSSSSPTSDQSATKTSDTTDLATTTTSDSATSGPVATETLTSEGATFDLGTLDSDTGTDTSEALSTVDSDVTEPDTAGDDTSTPEPFDPTVLWVNGLTGTCEYTDANDQAGLEVNGDIQPLYGSGWAAYLDAGQQTITLGSGVVGCRDDYAVFQENVQDSHIYLLTGWGNPTAYTEEAAWVDITDELTGDGGVILVNLSSVAPSVDFDLGAGEPVTVTAPNYRVVPGAAPSTIAAMPAAEPATVQGHSNPGYYWLVVYRDTADGTGAELASPAAVQAP